MKGSALADWLMEECNRRGLSYRQASLQAGVANNAVAEIVNAASHPSLPRIQALWTLVQDFEQFIAEMEPAAVSARLQLAGLRVCVEDRRPVRVSLV